MRLPGRFWQAWGIRKLDSQRSEPQRGGLSRRGFSLSGFSLSGSQGDRSQAPPAATGSHAKQFEGPGSRAGCEAYEPLLCASVDGELTSTEQRRLDAHLKSCANCRASLAEWETIHLNLASVAEVEMPASLQASIRSALAEEAARIQCGHFACEQVRPLLSAFLDGELAPGQREPVSDHLEECSSCSRQLASLRWTVRLLHALPAVEPPAGLRARVQARTTRRRTAPALSLLSTGGILAAAALFLLLRPVEYPSGSAAVGTVAAAGLSTAAAPDAPAHGKAPHPKVAKSTVPAPGNASFLSRSADHTRGAALASLAVPGRRESSALEDGSGSPALQPRPVPAENLNRPMHSPPTMQIALLPGPAIPSTVIARSPEPGPGLLKGPVLTVPVWHPHPRYLPPLPVSQASLSGNTSSGNVSGDTGSRAATGESDLAAPAHPGLDRGGSGPGDGGAGTVGSLLTSGSAVPAPTLSSGAVGGAADGGAPGGGTAAGAGEDNSQSARAVRLIVLRPAQAERLTEGVWSAAQDQRNKRVSKEASQTAQAVMQLEKGYAERKKGVYHDIGGAPRVGVSYERPVGF